MNDNSKQPKATQNKTTTVKNSQKNTTATGSVRKTSTSNANRAATRAPKVESKPITLQQDVLNKVTTQNTEPQKTPEKETAKKSIFARFRKQKMNVADISTVQRYSPDIKQGLTPAQVEERMGQDLYNDTDVKYSKSYRSIFIDNICTFFNLLCLIAVVALIYARSPIQNFFFVVVFALNIGIGIFQEIRAKLTIEKLSLVSSPTAKVIRGATQTEIPLKQIVLDDVITLATGQQVPTDCILAEGNVEVNESLLTGESVPVKKEIGDLLYAGSFVSSGACYARVAQVGKGNYIETLTAKAKKYKKPNSELLRSIKLIIRVVGILIVPIAVMMFLTNLKAITAAGEINAVSQAIRNTATVLIGMIPSGMFLLTSMALAIGVIRLARNNTLVQDLYSLEMLARVDVLCLDKTGTITDGRMKVSDCMLLNNNTDFTLNEIMGSFLAALDDNNQTSIALYNHFGHNSVLKPLATLPFSSKRKLSAVTFKEIGTYVMGAPEFVLGTVPDKLMKLINNYAAMGLRVLLVAAAPGSLSGEKLPSGLKPVALLTIADNIREDAISTIRWFKENDVDVKVISGDNPVTVAEVARRAGIENASKFISLEGLSEQEVANVATKYTVFGRVTPEQKAILVKALKTAGKTVAMTGDGVNDILAMKEADCSVSVASGSEAARNVSHLVLMDSNFSSMPKVVHEGRRVINNIQKSSSLYLMKTIFTAVFAVISIILRKQYPFEPSHMFILETFVIGAPSFALALQSNKNRVQGKFISYVFSRAIPCALIMILNVLVCQLLEHFGVVPNHDYYVTMSVYAISFGSLVILYYICKPLNLYRGIIFALMLIASIVMIAFLNDLWMKLHMIPFKDGWQYLLLVVCLVQLDMPLCGMLLNWFDKIRNGKKAK